MNAIPWEVVQTIAKRVANVIVFDHGTGFHPDAP